MRWRYIVRHETTWKSDATDYTILLVIKGSLSSISLIEVDRQDGQLDASGNRKGKLAIPQSLVILADIFRSFRQNTPSRSLRPLYPTSRKCYEMWADTNRRTIGSSKLMKYRTRFRRMNGMQD